MSLLDRQAEKEREQREEDAQREKYRREEETERQERRYKEGLKEEEEQCCLDREFMTADQTPKHT